jgi:hypothetical protein
LQPWHFLVVAALAPPALVDASSEDFGVFVLLVVDEAPLGTWPPMRLTSAVKASHWYMMRATISHSLDSVGLV